MQALANGWCTGSSGPDTPAPLDSLSFADLAVRGTDEKLKNPGSSLGFTYNTRTAYEFVGAIYETETQYTLTGNSVNVLDGVDTAASVASDTISVGHPLECGGGVLECTTVLNRVTLTNTVYNEIDVVQ